MQASDPGIFFLAAYHNMLTLSSTSPIGQIGADICKLNLCAKGREYLGKQAGSYRRDMD